MDGPGLPQEQGSHRHVFVYVSVVSARILDLCLLLLGFRDLNKKGHTSEKGDGSEERNSSSFLPLFLTHSVRYWLLLRFFLPRLPKFKGDFGEKR